MSDGDLNFILIDKVLKGSDSFSNLLGDLSSNYSADYYFVEGQNAYQEGEWARAFSYFKKALGVDLKHTNAWHKLYMMLYDIGIIDSFAYHDHIEDWHDSCKSLYNSGQFYFAAQEYKSLLMQKPDNPIIYYDAAKALSITGDLDEARKLFKKASEIYNSQL